MQEPFLKGPSILNQCKCGNEVRTIRNPAQCRKCFTWTVFPYQVDWKGKDGIDKEEFLPRADYRRSATGTVKEIVIRSADTETEAAHSEG